MDLTSRTLKDILSEIRDSKRTRFVNQSPATNFHDVDGYINRISNTFVDKTLNGLSDGITSIFTLGGKMKWLESIGRMVGDGLARGFGAFYDIEAQGVKVWRKYEEQSFAVAKNMGLTREQANGLMGSLRESTKEIAGLYGYTQQELAKIQETYSTTTQSARLLLNNEIETAAALSKVVGEGTWNTAVEQMDKMGASLETTGAYLELTQERAMKFGLNANKASEAFTKNLSLAQKYGFKEGVNGLSKMVMQAQRLKINMESIAGAADKFSNLESAIETSANIQVLGGSFATQFSNPLEVMAQSLTDFEGFQNRVVDAFKAKGTFNRESGLVEFSPIDRAMMKEMSKQLGISVDELNSMATQSVTKTEIEGQLNATANFSEEEKSAIASIAKFNPDNQKWEVNYTDEEGNQQAVEVANLNKNLLQQILPYTSEEKGMYADVRDIAGNVRLLTGQSKARVKDITSTNEKVKGAEEAAQAWQSGGLVDSVMKRYSDFINWGSGWQKENPNTAGVVKMATSIIGNVLGFGGFTEGGVIGGNEEKGDRILARVNSGEMVLNKEQQGNLLDAVKTNPNLPKFESGGIAGIGEQRILFNAANTNFAQQNTSTSSPISQGIMYAMGYKMLKSGGRLNPQTISALNNFGKAVKPLTDVVHEFKGTVSNTTQRLIKPLQSATRSIRGTNIMQSTARFVKPATNAITNAFQPATNLVKARLGKSSYLGKQARVLSLASKGQFGDAYSLWARNTQVGKTARLLRIQSEGKGGLVTRIHHQSDRSYLKLLKEYGTKIASHRGGGYLGRGLTKVASGLQKIGVAVAQTKSNIVQNVASKYTNRGLNGTKNTLKEQERLLQQQISKAQRIQNRILDSKDIVRQEGRFDNVAKAEAKASKDLARVQNRLKAVERLKSMRGGSSVVGRTLNKVGGKALGKTLAKMGGKSIPMVGTLLAAGFAVSDAMDAKNNYDAKKSAILNDESLSTRDRNNLLREAEDERNGKYVGAGGSALGGIGGAMAGFKLGATIGTFLGGPGIGTAIGGALGTAIGGFVGSEAGQWIGEKVGEAYNGVKDFFLGKEEELNDAEQAQLDYEESKFGMVDISDPQLMEKAALATCAMHDLMVSMWYNMNGKASNGSEISKGLFGEIGEWFGFGSKKRTTTRSSASNQTITNNEFGNSTVATLNAMGENPTYEGVIKPSDNLITGETLYQSPTYIAPVVNQNGQLVNQPQDTNSNNNINLNVNGTLRLDGGSTNVNLDMQRLLDNPQIKQQIIDIVLYGMQQNYGGGKRNANATSSKLGYGGVNK